ncbi:hypothetical protein ACFL6B_03545 [Thermodesulfobacteriota bacterium]
MSGKKPAISRRKWKRFRMKSGAIVMLHKPSLIGFGKVSYIELGPVIDISMGGLAVKYINSKKRQIDCFELSLSVANDGVRVEGMPFEVVADFKVVELPDGIEVRKRCVQFGKLDPYKSFQLETFIKNNTTTIITERRSDVPRRQFNDPRFKDEEFRAHHDRRVLGDRRQSI